MKPEIKQLWLEALRSGLYKQTQRQLRSRENEFCCLGVLCETYRQHTGKGGWSDNDVNMVFHDDINGDFSSTQLPSKVAFWARLFDLPENEDPIGACDLANLNDEGWDFNRIADLIEKKL